MENESLVYELRPIADFFDKINQQSKWDKLIEAEKIGSNQPKTVKYLEISFCHEENILLVKYGRQPNVGFRPEWYQHSVRTVNLKSYLGVTSFRAAGVILAAEIYQTWIAEVEGLES